MKLRYAIPISVLLILLTVMPVLASSGTPDSPKFGFGGRIDLKGDYVGLSIQAAARWGFDWIALDFDWAASWPDTNTPPNIEALTQAMALAAQNNTNVLISITNAPAWAMTPTGPDPNLTSGVAASLARIFPGTLTAIEPFPAANTRQGWGAEPNPAAYLQLIQLTQTALAASPQTVWVVAGGLTPLAVDAPAGDIPDTTFLEALYAANGRDSLPIISLRLAQLSDEPLAAPLTEAGYTTLRHFESIREVMLNNNHRQGLLWITGLSWPNGQGQPTDAKYYDQQQQEQWISQAYRMLKSQLYIGAAFFTQVNPPESVYTAQISLIRHDLSLHPAAARLALLINPAATPETTLAGESLSKKIPPDLHLKPNRP